jgi:hypothetical protein
VCEGRECEGAEVWVKYSVDGVQRVSVFGGE